MILIHHTDALDPYLSSLSAHHQPSSRCIVPTSPASILCLLLAALSPPRQNNSTSSHSLTTTFPITSVLTALPLSQSRFPNFHDQPNTAKLRASQTGRQPFYNMLDPDYSQAAFYPRYPPLLTSLHHLTLSPTHLTDHHSYSLTLISIYPSTHLTPY